jgi:hypothetical protein
MNARVIAGEAPIALCVLQERYFPCSVQWYFERSKLVSVEKVRNKVNVRTLLSVEETTAERVASAMLTLMVPIGVAGPLRQSPGGWSTPALSPQRFPGRLDVHPTLLPVATVFMPSSQEK